MVNWASEISWNWLQRQFGLHGILYVYIFVGEVGLGSQSAELKGCFWRTIVSGTERGSASCETSTYLLYFLSRPVLKANIGLER